MAVKTSDARLRHKDQKALVFSLLRSLHCAHPAYADDENYPKEQVARDMGFLSYKTMVRAINAYDGQDLAEVIARASMVLKNYGPGPFVDLVGLEVSQSFTFHNRRIAPSEPSVSSHEHERGPVDE